jgi:short-subunit dehydrogenase
MTSRSFSSKYGPWALITGSAEGLGAEFARQVAQYGLNILLVDVQIEKAQVQAELIASEEGVETRAIACDLSKDDFLEDILQNNGDLEIGMLICCAGLGTTGEFISTPRESMRRSIKVNCLSTMELTHHYSPLMVERGRGGIIIIASSSAYAGGPYIANYAATKAYDLSFAEGLWFELAPKGIDVFGFSPQGTNTPGMRRGMAGLQEGETPEGIMLPREAVSIALDGLGKLPSLRPDMPEIFSSERQETIEAVGQRTQDLTPYHAI